MKRRGVVYVSWALGCALALAPTPAIAQTSAQVRREVAQLQTQLDDLTTRIDKGEQRVATLKKRVDALADESVALQGQIIADRARLAQIVATTYKEGSEAHLFAVLLSCESLDEFVSQMYYAQKVSDWQTDCIVRLDDDKRVLESQIAKIDEAKEQQEEMLVQLAAQQDELDETIEALSAKADRLQEEEEEAARKAAEEARRKAEEAARKAEEERLAREQREAEERARQEALEAAQSAGDVAPTPTQGGTSGWITCIASAYTIADNDPPGSTATASGIPLDESIPTVAMPMSMSPARFYGSKIEISYNGMSVIATVTDCGAMGGGSRGLDLTPAVFRAFGFSTADDWGLREVSYRFL